MVINRDELLFVVDENDKPLAPLSRREVHQQRLWHRASHIWIANGKQQLLCQLRSANMDFNPNIWSPYFGGHVPAATEYLQAAILELEEELGLKAKPDQLSFNAVFRDTGPDRKFEAAYMLVWNGQLSELTPEVEEVAKIAWQPLSAVKQAYQNPKSKWVRPGYQQTMLNWIEKQLKH